MRKYVLALLVLLSVLMLAACVAPTAPQVAEKEAPAPEAKKPWELIDWDKPVPMTERLRADEYILPEGW
ncbi:MAG: hypothetical protein MAG451_00296 [Anaerolineales bacterium]|nr:hypothetical protein [Anaerolineales bacterium]